MTDGKTVLPLTMAQDYKRAMDGDEGPNTGGMGAYSPLPFVDEAMTRRIDEEILGPTIAAWRTRASDTRACCTRA